jgi:hypothetical protein
MRWALVMLLACGLAGCPATPGVTCTKHDECASLKNGYCSKAGICTRECTGPGTCGEGSSCFDAGVRQVCLPTCVDDAGCPSTRFACLPGDEGFVCQVASPLAPLK